MSKKNILKVVKEDIESAKKLLYNYELVLEMKGESIKEFSNNSYSITWAGKDHSSNIIYDKDIELDFIIKELLKEHQYSVLLYDRSLIQMEFIIENNEIVKQRLLFIKKHNKIWTKEEIVSISSLPDIDFFDYFFENKGIPTMIRIDYDVKKSKDCSHPISHMTISNHETCRIPIKSLISCTKFVSMILYHFYDIKQDIKTMEYVGDTITENEKKMFHIDWN